VASFYYLPDRASPGRRWAALVAAAVGDAMPPGGPPALPGRSPLLGLQASLATMLRGPYGHTGDRQVHHLMRVRAAGARAACRRGAPPFRGRAGVVESRAAKPRVCRRAGRSAARGLADALIALGWPEVRRLRTVLYGLPTRYADALRAQ
jgi:hypothetical protein